MALSNRERQARYRQRGMEARKAMGENVYEGQPDARQSADTNMKVSRFRPRYRALTPEEKALHDQIKDKACELEALYEKLLQGRYTALAYTSLEESVMWAVKQLTS